MLSWENINRTNLIHIPRSEITYISLIQKFCLGLNQNSRSHYLILIKCVSSTSGDGKQGGEGGEGILFMGPFIYSDRMWEELDSRLSLPGQAQSRDQAGILMSKPLDTWRREHRHIEYRPVWKCLGYMPKVSSVDLVFLLMPLPQQQIPPPVFLKKTLSSLWEV